MKSSVGKGATTFSCFNPMPLEFCTIESLSNTEETPKMSKVKRERNSRDMSLEAYIQTQIIQQDGKFLVG